MSATAEAGVSVSPYPGLRPFERAEADLFFGRRDHVKELVSKLERRRFLAVIGPSGCGKSSLVRAGLLPALESGYMERVGFSWRTAVFRPGGQPLRNLAMALREADVLSRRLDNPDEELAFLAATLRRGPLGIVEAVREARLTSETAVLVLVDQFEEIFRFRREAGTGEATAFVELLLASAAEPSTPIYVVITMRSDHLGNCTVFHGLPEAMNDSQFLTPRLTREQNQAAILGPARLFGVEIEPEVVTRILNEMGTDPDQLPLMQHLLMRMWRRATWSSASQGHDGRLRITMNDYNAGGGLAHELSKHVEKIYRQKLPDADSQRIAEMAFRNLTEITPDGQVVRRPVKLSEICAAAGASQPQVVSVLDQFRAEGRSFLTPSGSDRLKPDDVIDISHESLIRQWPRLDAWTKDEEKARGTQRDVARNLQKWLQSGRDRRALLSELPLLEAEAWATNHPRQVQPVELEFITASRDQLQRNARRQAWFTGVIAVLGILALVLAAQNRVAFNQADTQRKAALKAEQIAKSEEDKSKEAEQTAKEEAEKSKGLLREVLRNKAQGLSSASRSLLNQGDAAGALALAVEAGKLMKSNPEPIAAPKEVDEALLSALGSWRRQMALTPAFSPGSQNAWVIAISPNGLWLVAGGPGTAAQVRHLEGGSRRLPLTILDGHAESVDMVAISDGPQVATLDHQGVVRLWAPGSNPAKLRPIILDGHPRPADLIALSPDGRWLAGAGKNGAAWVWQLRNSARSAQLVPLSGHTQNLFCLAFSENSQWMATSDLGGSIRLWDVSTFDTAPKAQSLGGGSKATVRGVAFRPDSRRLVAVSWDGAARTWDIPDGRPLDPILPAVANRNLVVVAFSPDGRRLAIGEQYGRIHLRNLEDSTSEILNFSGSQSAIEKLAFSPPDGHWLAAQSATGSVGLWSLVGRKPVPVALPTANYSSPSSQAVTPRPNFPFRFAGFGFGAGGKALVTVKSQGGLLSWDLQEINPTSPFEPFGPDDSKSTWFHRIVAQVRSQTGASSEGKLPASDGLWSPESHDASSAWVVPGSSVSGGVGGSRPPVCAFAPDGHTMAIANTEGRIVLWDATSGPDSSPTTVQASRGPSTVAVLALSAATRNGRRCLAAGDSAGMVRLWNVSAFEPNQVPTELDRLAGEVLSLSFSPDGRWLAAASSQSPARLWNLDGYPKAPRVDLPGNPAGPGRVVAFDPHGSGRLVAGNSAGNVLLWKIGDGPPRRSPRRLADLRGAITRVLFTAGGQRLIATSYDGTARVWTMDSTGPGRADLLSPQIGGIVSLAVVPDGAGRWLATGGRYSDVRLWKLLEGDAPELHTIPADRSRGTVTALAFSGDGQRLAIATSDGSVRVFTVDGSGVTSESSLNLSLTDPVGCPLVLSRDGTLLIAESPRGPARVWPLRRFPAIDQLASEIAVRNLTASEHELYFPGKPYAKTFDHLPVHATMIESVRIVARQGRSAEAIDRLDQLVQIDRSLDIVPKLEASLAMAEGLLETARSHARRDQPDDEGRALFAAAKRADHRLDFDPQDESDKYAAIVRLAGFNTQIAMFRAKLQDVPHPFSQPAADQAGPDPTDEQTLFNEAEEWFKSTTRKDERRDLGLTYELILTRARLEALKLYKEALGLLAEANIAGATRKLDAVVERDPSSYRFEPKTEVQRLSAVLAKKANDEGKRLADTAQIVEATRELELASKLQPGLYKYTAAAEARRLAAAAAAAHARQADAEGRKLAAQKKVEDAARQFEIARKLDPGTFTYEPEAEAQQAVADLEKGQADFLLLSALTSARGGRDDLAESNFQKARDRDPSLVFEPKAYVKHLRAWVRLEQGQAFARAFMLDNAMAKFREANDLDPDLELDPKRMASLLTGRAYLELAHNQAMWNQAAALDALKKSRELLADAGPPPEPNSPRELDPNRQVRLFAATNAGYSNLGGLVSDAGNSLCVQGELDQAYAIYQKAREIDPLLNVRPDFWNTLCRQAAATGVELGKRFGFAGDLAVALEPANANYRDTRGIARALRGEREGAIKDFQAFLWTCFSYQQRQERQGWIKSLQTGSPVDQIFTPKVLARISRPGKLGDP
jgi:WD40 repeat protein